MKFSLSVLELATVGSGQTAPAALQAAVELARFAEEAGYTRFWLAEHHGMPSIASSSPEVLIAHVAAATGRIRVGSGGIMLPNHAPLRIAEAFHTLEALHPGRIDLGIGRAPGTDPATSMALRPFDAEKFPQQVHELISLSARSFPEGHPFHSVRVAPEDVPLPPIWILGSSGATAQLAGQLGLGYGFAAHFSPNSPLPAAQLYRQAFQPSERFPKPHFILALSVVCAPTHKRADRLAKSMDLAWIRLHRRDPGPFPSPEEAEAHVYSPAEQALVRDRRRLVIVGDPPYVRRRIEEAVKETGADEVMISTMVHDPAARRESYALIAEALNA